jgi:hypothetical protein
MQSIGMPAAQHEHGLDLFIGSGIPNAEGSGKQGPVASGKFNIGHMLILQLPLSI